MLIFSIWVNIFFDISSSVFHHFSLFLLIFSPEKWGPIDSPRHCRFNGVFFIQNGQNFTQFRPLFRSKSTFSNFQIIEIHFFLQKIEIGNFENARDGNLKPNWRACGLPLATKPSKVDGGARGTPRHFNIIAYGWILGDERQFSEKLFWLSKTLNNKTEMDHAWVSSSKGP